MIVFFDPAGVASLIKVDAMKNNYEENNNNQPFCDLFRGPGISCTYPKCENNTYNSIKSTGTGTVLVCINKNSKTSQNENINRLN
jgi:hypothetical protein